MRILVYPHDLNMGGSQTNAIELAAAVKSLGHESIVYGRRGSLCARIDELGLEFVEAPEPGRRPSLRIARDLRRLVRERGIDISNEYPKPWTDEVVRAADVVITMGCGDACPIFPGKRYEEWVLDDPDGLSATDIRPIRDEIERRVLNLLDELSVVPQFTRTTA